MVWRWKELDKKGKLIVIAVYAIVIIVFVLGTVVF